MWWGNFLVVFASVAPPAFLFPYKLVESSHWYSLTVWNIPNIFFGVMGNAVLSDRVQPKTSPFSSQDLIRVNYKVLSLLYLPIFLSFSYLNSAPHFQSLNCVLSHLKNGFRENWLTVFCYWFSCFFQQCKFSHVFIHRTHDFMAK